MGGRREGGGGAREAEKQKTKEGQTDQAGLSSPRLLSPLSLELLLCPNLSVWAGLLLQMARRQSVTSLLTSQRLTVSQGQSWTLFSFS